jgi:hypothetical protein
MAMMTLKDAIEHCKDRDKTGQNPLLDAEQLVCWLRELEDLRSLKGYGFIAKVVDFVNERRKSDGGYAPVEEDDFGMLSELIHELIALKWESDPDGDFPINVKIINRKTHWPLHYMPLYYDHHVEDGEVPFDAYMRMFTINASIFQKELESALRLMARMGQVETASREAVTTLSTFLEKEKADELWPGSLGSIRKVVDTAIRLLGGKITIKKEKGK